MLAGAADRKRRSREWEPRIMSTEVFETPDPEVTFQPYAAVHAPSAAALAFGGAPEDTHGFDKANMELDEGAVLPNHAFEVFMGKVYKPTARLPERFELEASGGRLSDVPMPTATRGSELESPLQRFTRLAMELKELESDLGLLAANAEAKRTDASAVVVVDAAQNAEFSEIMSGLATLQLNLSAMEQHASFRPFLQPAVVQPDAVASMQRDLTAKFFQQIDALKRAQPSTAAVSSGSPSSAPIVYEIYSNGELNAVDRDAKTRLLTLESRLAMLEKVIGATNPKELHVDGLRASASASADLSSLIDELDKRVGMLSEKNLDAIKTRTTALVHEFTLLHKLKESPNVQGALATQADREKIQQIYDKLHSVEDVAASVPALVDRLVTLKAVHDESLDLGTRVKKMEQSQTMLHDLLESDVSILTNIEKSLQENVQIFQANIQTLDERMNHLLSGGR